MQNAAFEHLNLDYCYVTFSVRPEELGDAVRGIRALNLRGVNVTVPHKEAVTQFLDEISEEASFIGAVNTIVNDGGRLKGHNTDGRGFMRSLAEAGILARDKRVLIIGAGGAARAVTYYLCKEASHLFLYNRHFIKATSLMRHLASLRCDAVAVQDDIFADKKFITSIDIIINATPLGLRTDDPLPIDRELLTDTHTVCDLIYRDTALLQEAARRGGRTLNGLGMLLWQGAICFEIWTGVQAPVGVMRDALSEKMSS